MKSNLYKKGAIGVTNYFKQKVNQYLFNLSLKNHLRTYNLSKDMMYVKCVDQQLYPF